MKTNLHPALCSISSPVGAQVSGLQGRFYDYSYPTTGGAFTTSHNRNFISAKKEIQAFIANITNCFSCGHPHKRSQSRCNFSIFKLGNSHWLQNARIRPGKVAAPAADSGNNLSWATQLYGTAFSIQGKKQTYSGLGVDPHIFGGCACAGNRWSVCKLRS